ncbi:DUF1236 domain-containing protein [Methylobacterium nodulans]|uniref:DUF1236 domain-containing protein n=1 Tax=Methylobacterium nodulans (strain LMG 21967 / CNCM I-2342 / ORS 2060) TaxID=460265 RepID=B8IN88_METNO|nr:DUF1236 domain-containing protein [Methylobacterium nodulans]ACL62204.1 protein of unknown function DUF1236 [Methylobacterium nodulans ORS 2060]
MKRALSAAAALTLIGGAALAQTVTITEEPVEIAPPQRVIIKKYVTEQRVAPVRIRERVTVGSTLPADIDLHPLPPTVIEESPRLKGYSYVTSGDDIYVVEPRTRRIITTID